MSQQVVENIQDAVWVVPMVLAMIGLWLYDRTKFARRDAAERERQRELDRQIRAAIDRADKRERAKRARELGWN